MKLFLRTRYLAAGVIVLGLAGAAQASDVLAGFDLWTTPPGGAFEDFGGACPIPADFFAPGSDPFTGVVTFVGQPLGLPNTANADTMVERLATAQLATVPSTDTIAIELIALSLVSISPITVTEIGGQNPTFWDVEVDQSPTNPSTGQMTINHTTTEGGTYNAQINVCGRLTFIEVGNPGNVRVLDYCNDCDPQGQVVAVTGQPWCHDMAQPQASPLSGPNFLVKGTTQHTGPHPASNPIEQPAPVGAIPTVSEWGLMALGLLLAGAGAIVLRRRTVARSV